MRSNRFVRMLVGGLVSFVILGGVAALPNATRAVGALHARQLPATLEAVLAIPRTERKVVLKYMSDEAKASIMQQALNRVLAGDEASPELKAVVQRMKPLLTAEYVKDNAARTRAYMEADQAWRKGEGPEPDRYSVVSPEMAVVMQDLEALPGKQWTTLDYIGWPEVGKESSVAFWFRASSWLHSRLANIGLNALPQLCLCWGVYGPGYCVGNHYNCPYEQCPSTPWRSCRMGGCDDHLGEWCSYGECNGACYCCTL